MASAWKRGFTSALDNLKKEKHFYFSSKLLACVAAGRVTNPRYSPDYTSGLDCLRRKLRSC